MRKWIIITAIAIVVIGGGVAAYFTAQSNKTKDDKTTTANKTETGKFSNACKVITKAAAETAFGVTFLDSRQEGGRISPGGSGAIDYCRYDEKNDGTPTGLMKAINLTIEVDTYTTTDAAKTALTATKKTDKVGDTVYFVRTDIPEVGDEAFFFQGQAQGVLKTQEYMYARKANQILHFVATRIDGIDHEKTKTAFIELAKKALN